MSNMAKQIIKVASEIAQNVSKNMRIANEADGSGCRELDFLNMENRAFRAAVEVLSDHPLLDPDFAPITVDLGLFPPKPADHPKAFPVSLGDMVKFGANQPAIDGFTVGKLYEVVGTSFDMITTTCNGEDYKDHYRHQFFSRFDPAPKSDVMLFTKADIESGKLDGCKVWPEYCNVWFASVDGKPHFVDDAGWIHARGYMPVDACIILTDRQYKSGFEALKNSQGEVRADAPAWPYLLRFKLA